MKSKEASAVLFKNKKLRQLRAENKLKYQIADFVLEARLKKGLTQVQLAKKIGTKQPSIARIENGDILPSLLVLAKIARALEMDLVGPCFVKLDKSVKTNISPATSVCVPQLR